VDIEVFTDDADGDPEVLGDGRRDRGDRAPRWRWDGSSRWQAALAAGWSRRRRRAIASVAAGIALAGFLVYALEHPAKVPTPQAVPSVLAPEPPRASPTPVAVPPGALDLNNATIQLPARPDDFVPCEGTFTFVKNVARSPSLDLYTLFVDQELLADVNADGRPDTVAVIRCESDLGTGLRWQVIAAEAGAYGTVVVIGSVLTDNAPAGPGALFDVSVTPDGAVVAEVGDFSFPTHEQIARIDAKQVRSYRWKSDRFVQETGPASFPVNPNAYDLAVSTTGLTLHSDGSARSGTLGVTVTNLGPGAATNVVVSFALPRTLPRDIEALKQCALGPTDDRSTIYICLLDRLPAGEHHTFTLIYAGLSNEVVTPALGAWIVAVWGEDQLGTGTSLDPVRINDQAIIQIVAA
jgi:hypothetical protein